jgi:uncharacterized protein YutD
MLCDWIGAALANKSYPDPKGYWESNKDKMELHEDTIKIIEELLDEYAETKMLKLLLKKSKEEEHEARRDGNRSSKRSKETEQRTGRLLR